MQITETPSDTKDHILQAFQHLLSERKQGGSKIATKQEAVKREAEKQVVEKGRADQAPVVPSTLDHIIKTLSVLRPGFGDAVSSSLDRAGACTALFSTTVGKKTVSGLT